MKLNNQEPATKKSKSVRKFLTLLGLLFLFQIVSYVHKKPNKKEAVKQVSNAL